MLHSSILSNLRHNYAFPTPSTNEHLLVKRADHRSTFFVVAACLIPVLVILSGIFAGLTLGYMSLDETQLNVLATSGTPKQREYAKKIIPVRRNGHLLLVSLLLANMIVNESLPIISDEVLGGGISAVAVSTVLIVIFSEIIPQSLCTRYGLYIGAKCAIPVRVLMYSMWIVAWPVAKLLEMILGPHHGIIYRRGELKELINMHSSVSPHGGDLKHDTVTIIGHTLDLQEKVVKDAMTPIEKVFMLPIDARLDYETLRCVCESGHSRVPVYEEIDVKVGAAKRAKKIVGILLVKQCVLLDPNEATPLRAIPLNHVPSVPFDESLLRILDRFQEGRSHMAIVSLFSKGRAASVKDAVKTGLTRRFLNRVGLGEDDEARARDPDLERTWGELRGGNIGGGTPEEDSVAAVTEKDRPRRFRANIEGREQAMPADAVLASEDADEFLSGIDTEVNPLGIITLEDVLEELIGEEILDEFDLTGPQAASSYVPPSAKRAAEDQSSHFASPFPLVALPAPAAAAKGASGLSTIQFPIVASTLNIFSRSRSHPGTPRVDTPTPPDHTPTSRDKEKELYPSGADGGIVTPEPINDIARPLSLYTTNADNDGTDATTLHVTLTLETDTTTVWSGPDVQQTDMNGSANHMPNIVVSEGHDDQAPSSSLPGSFLGAGGRILATPRVTEAILQTQTRRRAQLQQHQAQAHSTANSGPSSGLGSTAMNGELQLPVQRQVPRGSFKSTPLTTVASRATEEHNETSKDNPVLKDKPVESDPDQKEPKDGL